MVRLSPDPELAAPVEAAAQRWSAATGCRIDIGAPGDGGVPVALVATVLRPDGSEAPAVTSAARDRLEVNARVGAAQRQRTLDHELGHVLGGDHTASDGVLSGEPGRRDVIDPEALESVCSRLRCSAFSPESP